MEIINTTIAIIFLLISGITLYFGKKQYVHDSEIEYREELARALLSFQQCKHTIATICREKNKTGCKIDDNEKIYLNKLENTNNEIDEIYRQITQILQQDNISIDRQLLSQVHVLRNAAKSIIH